MATVDELKSRMRGGGLRLNQYRIILPRIPGASIDSQEVSILCKATSLPATTNNPITVHYFGLETHFAGESTYNPWNITMLTDTNTNTRDAFEKWMSLFKNYTTSLGEEDVTKYQIDCRVEALSRSGKVAKAYDFKNVFPISVGEINMSYDANEIASFDVTLRFDYFEPSSRNQGRIK